MQPCIMPCHLSQGFNVRSEEFKLLNVLQSDPAYHKYLLLCKIYVSLCNINKVLHMLLSHDMECVMLLVATNVRSCVRV